MKHHEADYPNIQLACILCMHYPAIAWRWSLIYIHVIYNRNSNIQEVAPAPIATYHYIMWAIAVVLTSFLPVICSCIINDVMLPTSDTDIWNGIIEHN